MKKVSLLAGFGALVILAGCSGSTEPDEYDVESYDAISNPASVFCVQQGGDLQAFTEDNARVMYCVFSEDEKYEQWAYYEDNYKKAEE